MFDPEKMTWDDLQKMRKIIREVDVPAARRYLESQRVDLPLETIELAIHKTRVESEWLSDAERLGSIEWLRIRGFRRYKNMPLPPVGHLPG